MFSNKTKTKTKTNTNTNTITNTNVSHKRKIEDEWWNINKHIYNHDYTILKKIKQ